MVLGTIVIFLAVSEAPEDHFAENLPPLSPDLAQLLHYVPEVKQKNWFVGADLWLGANGVANTPQTALSLDENGFWDIGELYLPQDSQSYGSAVVLANAEILWGPFQFRTLLSSSEIRRGSTLDPPFDGVALGGRPADDFLASGAWVRELVLTANFSPVRLAVGRDRLDVGDHLAYFDYATGAFATLDKNPFHAQLSVVAIGHTREELQTPSPLVAWRADYDFLPFQTLSFFAATFVERSGILRDALQSVTAERIIYYLRPQRVQTNLDVAFDPTHQSRGNLSYLGVSTHLVPWDHLTLRATALTSFGRLDVETASRIIHLRLLSYAAQVQTIYSLWQIVDLGVTGVLMSGDEAPQLFDNNNANYRGFVGLAPYWTWTGLFFSGGINQGLYPARAQVAGVNGHGVVAAGPVVSANPSFGFCELRLVYLQALAAPPPLPYQGNGWVYGVELDLYARWDINRWLGLSAEIDVLWPGNYFPSQKTAYRGLGYINVHVGD